MSLSKIAATGTRRETLEVLRDRLAAEIDATSSPPYIASLALRLTDVLEQIDNLTTPTKQVCPADEIAKRRVARRGARTKNQARAARSG